MPSIRYRNGESNPSIQFEKRWSEGLNSQQASAVDFNHSEGAVLVLAGAGSGKTTVLTRRIARLYRELSRDLESGAGRQGILALTFTKDAAKEMAERLRGLLDLDAQTPGFPKIGTFHAFALGMIRAYTNGTANWRRLGFAKEPILDDMDAHRTWVKGRAAEIAPDLSLNQIEACFIAPFEGSEGVYPGSQLAIRAQYRLRLLETGTLAFDDMVALAVKLFSEFPEVLADFQARTAYVLVDEFQDTSRDQLELIRIMMGSSRNLFLVGDDDQAIYGFRGADPGNIGAAMQAFPGLRILKLETNYRSTAPIVAFANSVFKTKSGHLRKRLVAGRTESGRRRPAPVRKVIHEGGADQARWMAEEMVRLHRDENLAWNQMAILFRLNALEAYYKAMLVQLVGAAAAEQVILSTVHGAKGLEYPAVFFVGLEDGVLPFRRRGEPLAVERMEEEKRIFYVGVTRAQRYLYLCASKRRMLRGRSVEAEISPFLRGRFLALWRRMGGKE